MTNTDLAILDNVVTEFPDYLRDESRLSGCAETISFPRTEAAVAAVFSRMHELRLPVTVQGARTGVAGGAVPRSGHILNLGRMNRVRGLRRQPGNGAFLVQAEPGVVLADLRRAVRTKEFDTAGWSEESRGALSEFRDEGPWFFPPDPTETSATVGGMAAANASGACSFSYGPTRPFVESVRAVLSDGSVLSLRRRREQASGRDYAVRCTGGRVIRGRLPAYRMPPGKNAAGYYAADNMDLLDLLIGSEGTLAALTEIELRLLPAPGTVWGVMAFFPEEAAGLDFVRHVRSGGSRPAAMEFFDTRALGLLREQKPRTAAFAGLPDSPPGDWTAVYVEYHGADEDDVGARTETMTAAMTEHGGAEDLAWLATTALELEKLKTFRHAVPEAVNLRIDERRKTSPGVTKLGTDMAVPDAHLESVMALYRAGLAAEGLEYVVFGHIGNNHVHVNILPRNGEEYARGRQLYLAWAKAVVQMGGTISAEHGVGKLKTALLEEMYGTAGIAEMRAVKRAWDPEGLMNPGTLFPAPL